MEGTNVGQDKPKRQQLSFGVVIRFIGLGLLRLLVDLVMWFLTGRPLFGQQRKRVLISRESPKSGSNIKANIRSLGFNIHWKWFWNAVVVGTDQLHWFKGTFWKRRKKDVTLISVAERETSQSLWERLWGYGDMDIETKAGEEAQDVGVNNYQRVDLISEIAHDMLDHKADIPIDELYYFRLKWGTFLYIFGWTWWIVLPAALVYGVIVAVVTSSPSVILAYIITALFLEIISLVVGSLISN